jgi:hypothetical protein
MSTIEEIAARYREHLRAMISQQIAASPYWHFKAEFGGYLGDLMEADRDALAKLACERIESDHHLQEHAWDDARDAKELAAYILAAIEYRKTDSGRAWDLREGFTLGLREQYLLARRVIEEDQRKGGGT